MRAVYSNFTLFENFNPHARDGDYKLIENVEALFCRANQGQKNRTPLSPVNLGHNGVRFNFTCDVLMSGGGEGNRTPVQKPLDTTFFGCRLSIELSHAGVGSQTTV